MWVWTTHCPPMTDQPLFTDPPDTPDQMPQARAWVAVASAAHVRIGRAAGIMQVGHGKGPPLRRIKPGDRVAYYSPTVTLGGQDKCQAFTAIGTVLAGEPYQADMGNGFVPWRRDVAWDTAHEAPIAPLLGELSFSAGRSSWGAALRFGLLTVTPADMSLIAIAMGAIPVKA